MSERRCEDLQGEILSLRSIYFGDNECVVQATEDVRVLSDDDILNNTCNCLADGIEITVTLRHYVESIATHQQCVSLTAEIAPSPSYLISDPPVINLASSSLTDDFTQTVANDISQVLTPDHPCLFDVLQQIKDSLTRVKACELISGWSEATEMCSGLPPSSERYQYVNNVVVE